MAVSKVIHSLQLIWKDSTLLCAAEDGQVFWMMCLFVIHPALATSKCRLLVLMAELSDKYVAVPSLVLQNNPVIVTSGAIGGHGYIWRRQ